MIEFVAIILTPGVLIDGLENQIINGLQSCTNLKIIWRKYWRIPDRKTVFSIYPRLPAKPFSNAIIKVLTKNRCLFLIAEGENVCTLLTKIKGEFKFCTNGKIATSGLRSKYRPQIQNDDNADIRFEKIFDFRIHTTDTTRETAILCLVCMSPEEIEEIKNIAPLLYEAVQSVKQQIV